VTLFGIDLYTVQLVEDNSMSAALEEKLIVRNALVLLWPSVCGR
jgi:hypothetical protein